MTVVRYVAFLVIVPTLTMHYQFNEKHEQEIIACTKTAQDLIAPVLTQLRLLCFVGERICFDHTEVFIFDEAAPSGAGYTIKPLPFDRYLPSFSDAHDLKRCWFAYVVAWLKRGIALQKGEFANEVDLYVAYTTYRIARALEDLEGIALCDEPAMCLDGTTQQLLKNTQALQRLCAIIQPLPPIELTIMRSGFELAKRDSFTAQMYQIITRLFRAVGQPTRDERWAPFTIKLRPRIGQAAYRLCYDSYFRVHPIEWGKSVSQDLFEKLGIYQDVQLAPV